ncbi:MAG: DNA primase [Holosporales bacterium]|nr:DNA primase [Holosporales bacterium]
MTEFSIVLNRIKEKIPLSKIVGQDVYLQKKGREFVGNCPFHHEKTGSFFVNDEKGTFYCFGCGISGDLIGYVIKKWGITFQQAIEKLAEQAGVKLPEKKVVSHEAEVNQKVLQKAVEFFKNTLNNDKIAKEYCKSRGITADVIEKFSIGYAPFNNDVLLKYLREFGFQDKNLISSGLFIKKDLGLSPRFRNRLMFPVFDRKGWPIAFGGRGIHKDSIPKYLNSPESEIFQKREILYAYNISSRNVNENVPFIVVEGYIDVVMLHKFGFETAIASMGTAFSAEHLAKIWRYSKEPIICFDGDEAGYKAMLRLADIAIKCISHEKSAKFAMIPGGDDPDSFLMQYGKQKFENILKNSMHFIDFIWNDALINFNDIKAKTPEHIAKWKKAILDKTLGIQDSELKKLYRNDLSNRIFETLNPKRINNNFSKKYYKDIFSINVDEKICLREAILLCIIIEWPVVIPSIIESLSLTEFSNSSFEKLRAFVVDNHLVHLDNIEFVGEDLKNIVASVKKIAGEYCRFDDMNDEEITDFWHSIFGIEFWEKEQKKELLSAKAECKSDINSEKWERLKALKISALQTKNRG